MVEGEGSSVMGASQEEDWGDDADEDIALEKSSVAGSIGGRTARGYRGEIRGSGYGGGMTEDQLTALLQEIKKSSYVTMCQVIESRNAVDLVDQRVSRMYLNFSW